MDYELTRTRIKCLLCGDIIESKNVHNLVSCKCGSCYIDGGQYYAHIGANDFRNVVKILEDGREIHYEDENGMKEFEIEIEEILQKVIKVNAENKEEALRQAKKKYEKEELILDEYDFKEVNFK